MKTHILLSLMTAIILTLSASPVRGADDSDTLQVEVKGLCGECETRIEGAALKSRGVESVSWEAETKILRVSYNPKTFRSKNMQHRIASAGHDTPEYRAPDPVYNSLPQCCKYRDFSSHDEALGYEDHDHEGNDEDQGDNSEALITGSVLEASGEARTALPGANIYWAGSSGGSTSDNEGLFSLLQEEGDSLLVVSFVGYSNDTISISGPSEVEVVFSSGIQLGEVEVAHRVKSTSASFGSIAHLTHIHEKELTKAACCNLSESFETNPTVDASVTDAVTGIRKIEMLGLAGPYVQITRENMPDIRVLSSLTGLAQTPGSWIQGIQINTGSGSVANGFESITGQINVELKKPEQGDRLFLNLYGNSDGTMESNLISSYALSEKWSGSLLLHGNFRPFSLDHNEDGFKDHPSGQRIIALKRFKYQGEHGFESQIGIKAYYSKQVGGQIDFDPAIPVSNQGFWGNTMDAKRLEVWAKAGKVFENRPFSSLGFQVSGLIHDQMAIFGRRPYSAIQKSLYSNLIYQSILASTNHQYRTGISMQADYVDEDLGTELYSRREYVPGAFLEYTFNHLDIFSLVAGIRADYHNNYGVFATPRLHIRYEPVDKSVIRLSAGRGLKTASIFAENLGYFASSRAFVIQGVSGDTPYGLDPEIAWNTGAGFLQGFDLGAGPAVFKADYYYTRFLNQVVVDLDRSAREVSFYNLEGLSFAHSMQLSLDLEAVEEFDIRLAYRLNDARSTYDGILRSRPFSSRHRTLLNLAYKTPGSWSFDFTWNWQSSKRLPSTEINPSEHRRESISPAFSLFNLQLSKNWERLEIYTGIENLLDFKQDDPIIAPGDPFGEYFDASMIWGPVFGRKIYAGLRYRL